MTSRYAILSVFDYRGVLSKADAPKCLLGMAKDIERSFYMATELLKISRRNITIITDVETMRESNPNNPWDKKKGDTSDNHPNIVRLTYPSDKIVIEAIAQFINKIALIERKMDNKVEIFSYFSGHGVILPDPRDEKGQRSNCIVLMDATGRERRYLSRRELINLFHNRYKADDMGLITIPILQRKLKPSAHTTEYIYTANSIMINLGIGDTLQAHVNTNILFLYDSCHAGTLPGLKYRYLKDNIFELTFKDESTMPLSVGIGATNDIQEAPSCNEGSPFTSQMCSVIKSHKDKGKVVNIRRLHGEIHSSLHPLLVKSCYPTVSISEASLSVSVPILN